MRVSEKNTRRKNLGEGENELNAGQVLQDVSDITKPRFTKMKTYGPLRNETQDDPSKSLRNVTKLQNLETALTSGGCRWPILLLGRR